MEHNLEDHLTMESIENVQMDFEHTGVEVTQEEMCLEDNVQIDSMGMDIVQEQPTIIESNTEEIIVPEFLGEHYEFQEYSVPTENTSGANITIDASQLSELTAQNEQIIDMQYMEPHIATSSQAGLVALKSIQQRPIVKKATATAPFPKQVAIAPKPIKGAPNVQFAIAPKPVTIMMNKSAIGSKSISIKNVGQNLKGNTVLAQIGKQLVMMPAGQKLKLSSVLPGTSADASNIQIVRDSAQLVSNKGGKQVKTKFIIQGQSSTDPAYQPAVLTKLAPATSAAPTLARYIMQQKTVPISIGGNKVFLTSPTKQSSSMKVAPKKQIIIKAEVPKTTTSQANIQTKKIVITANPSVSQIKTSAVKTIATQSQGQRTQLHPINVPGKGIHYIKLVTNQPAVQKPAPKPQTVNVGGKSYVLTDNKGNILQMSGDRVISSQPPPLLVTPNASLASVSGKGRKLVRIAPISSTSEPSTQSSKILQSLLVPREHQPSATIPGVSVSLEDYNQVVMEQSDQNLLLSEESMLQEETVMEEQEEMDMEAVQESIDVKPTLASLVSDAVGEPQPQPEPEAEAEHPPVEVRYRPRKQEYFTEDENSSALDNEIDHDAPHASENVIILPHGADERDYQDDSNASMGNGKMSSSVTVDPDTMDYLSPDADKSHSDAMLIYESNSALRPRKACNCTKSQCLKLYCDCFANGEFCNQCNCNNCHNNLQHEDTRQKAIRACLERNPNAFRPKIGKAKAGGPEIVRRHNKGCNCKRSGCLKNYCECYEAKIACTLMCKCVGCRNIEETVERRRDALRMRERLADPAYRQPLPMGQVKQPCSFLTREVIEAVAQCMLATVTEDKQEDTDPLEDILLEFSRCMADIISASHQAI